MNERIMVSFVHSIARLSALQRILAQHPEWRAPLWAVGSELLIARLTEKDDWTEFELEALAAFMEKIAELNETEVAILQVTE